MFVCEGCLHPNDDWGRTKFEKAMGTSYGPCECCSQYKVCVDAIDTHAVTHKRRKPMEEEEVKERLGPPDTGRSIDRFRESPIVVLMETVEAAIRVYDRSGDHLKHAPDADCIRCRLAESVGVNKNKEGALSTLAARTWERVHKDKDGHKLFTKTVNGKVECDRFYVADGSGGTPDKTDDGELYIGRADVEASGIVISAPFGSMTAALRVHKLKDLEDRFGPYTVGLSLGCTLYIARAWGIPVKLVAAEGWELVKK